MFSAVDLNAEQVESLDILERECSFEGDKNIEVTGALDISPAQNFFINSKIIFEGASVFKENAGNQINLAKFEMFSSSKENFENFGAEKMDSVLRNPKAEETYEDYGTGIVSGFNDNHECIIQQQDVKEGLKKFFESCLPDKDGFVSKQEIVIKFEDKFKESIPKNYLDIVKDTVMLSNDDVINFETFYSTLKYWIENILMNKTCSFSSPERHILNFKLVDTLVSNEDSDFEDFLTDSGYKPFCIVRDDPNRRSTLQSGKILQRLNSNDYPLPSPIRESESENADNEQSNRNLCPDFEEIFDFTVGSIETDSNTTQLDPIELKDEVLELTFANKKLIREREILCAQNTQADIAQAALRKKCENLENSLTNAQAQMGRFRIVEEENQKLKMEIAEQIQFNSELKATLTLSQDNYETLLKNFESLKEEAEAVSEKLEHSLQEKERLMARIAECLNEVNKLNECNGTLNEKLNFKDLKIENLSNTVMCLEVEIQKLQTENCNLMGELHQLKDDHRLIDMHKAFRAELAMANGSFFVDYDNTGGEKSNDSPSSSQSPSPSESKEKETTTPVNIRDEICSSDISDAGSALPFCEKDASISSSTSSNSLLISLQKSLSKWKHWKKKTMTFAEDLHSSGTLDDEAQSLLEDHMDELISLTKKWRSFLNIKIECEVKPCKKISSPERFSLTSWSSLEWESPRDDATESKSKDEDQILDQSTIITVSDPSKDITEKDSKIGDLLSPFSKKGTPLSRNQDVFNEPTNVSSTSAREEKKDHQLFPHKQNLFMKCCGKDEETSPFTSPTTARSDDEAVVSSSTESSILHHEFPITADDIKSPKTPEETKFLSSDFQSSNSQQILSRTPNDVSIASPRSRKIILFVVGILSIILSVCSILSYLLRKEAQKWCYNNPHLRGHGSWIPFFHVQYSGEPPY